MTTLTISANSAQEAILKALLAPLTPVELAERHGALNCGHPGQYGLSCPACAYEGRQQLVALVGHDNF